MHALVLRDSGHGLLASFHMTHEKLAHVCSNAQISGRYHIIIPKRACSMFVGDAYIVDLSCSQRSNDTEEHGEGKLQRL